MCCPMASDQATVIKVRIGATVVGKATKIWFASCCRQHRKTACRKTEGSDALRVNSGARLPVVCHEVDEARQVAAASSKIGGPALIPPVVTCMGDAGDDIASLGQGSSGVMVAAKIATITVRNDDQWPWRVRERGRCPDTAFQ